MNLFKPELKNWRKSTMADIVLQPIKMVTVDTETNIKIHNLLSSTPVICINFYLDKKSYKTLLKCLKHKKIDNAKEVLIELQTTPFYLMYKG